MGRSGMATEITPPPDGPAAIPPPPDYQGPAPTEKPGLTLGRVGQIAKEELGKVPGRVVEDVKAGVEGIVHPKMSTVLPLSLGPGAGVVSRVGSVAAGRMLDDPKATVGENLATAGTAATTAGLWEAAFGVAPKLGASKFGIPSLEALSKRVGAFKYATEAPMKAYEAIKDRVPKGKWMFVPTINPKQAITAKEAAETLGTLTGLEYEVARKEIKAELDRLDIWRGGLPDRPGRGPRPYAGSSFETRTSDKRFEPSDVAKKGAAAVKTLRDPFTRTAADVAATEDAGGIPLGLWPPLMATPESLRGIAEKVIRR